MDSSFLSNATGAGQMRQTDATHANVTVTHVKMGLQLNVSICVPNGASQHVAEHEEGHLQIAEYYYQTANKVAERIATIYVGRQVEITGSDPQAESDKFLQQTAAITGDYSGESNRGQLNSFTTASSTTAEMKSVSKML